MAKPKLSKSQIRILELVEGKFIDKDSIELVEDVDEFDSEVEDIEVDSDEDHVDDEEIDDENENSETKDAIIDALNQLSDENLEELLQYIEAEYLN